MSRQPAPSAQRTVEIIRFLAEHPLESFAVADLARRLDQSRATCQAVLSALEAADWAQRTDGGYSLGAGLIFIGAAATQGSGIVERLRTSAEELHRSTGYEVLAYVPSSGQLVVVAHSGHGHSFWDAFALGQTFRLAPPFGLALVAWNTDELEHWISLVPHLNPGTRDNIREGARLVRELGYAVAVGPSTRRGPGSDIYELYEARRAQILSHLASGDLDAPVPTGQHRVQISDVTAPIFGPHGQVVALMGVPLGIDDQDNVREVVRSLLAATRAVSDFLGAQRDHVELR